MKTNKITFLIALGISVFFNIPRLNYHFGNVDPFLDNLIEVSVEDTAFRILSLFSFCFVVLKFNLSWKLRLQFKYQKWVSFSINILFYLFWMLLLRLVDLWVYDFDTFSLSPQIMNFTYLLVMLILIVISRIIRLTLLSKQNAIEKERLVQQNLQNELSALRNQVNPHFLFNSLNTLSLLIRQDQSKAERFIQKLSFLYRYILQSKDQDLVTLEEELGFLESYLYLIRQRYDSKFTSIINVDPKYYNSQIPSLSLQLLLENAVKHNEISKRNPLEVLIYTEDNFVVVKNKLQARKLASESTNIGLSNLQSRFKLLLNKDIRIVKDDTHFTVKLPII